jgi:hypothetical protein
VEGDDDQDSEDEADTEPGGNDAKAKNAFRWVPIHPLLDKLGIIARRDAIVADYMEQKFSEAGGKNSRSKARRDAIEDEAYQRWLFPEWKVYILPSGQVRWSHAVSKAWQYVKVKFKMQRKGLTLYSARHSFKGFIDDLKSLSERSRRIVMGHATVTDTSGEHSQCLPRSNRPRKSGMLPKSRKSPRLSRCRQALSYMEYHNIFISLAHLPTVGTKSGQASLALEADDACCSGYLW